MFLRRFWLHPCSLASASLTDSGSSRSAFLVSRALRQPLLPPDVHLTTDFAYFRWHGRGTRPWFDYKYSKEELDQWVPKVEIASGKVKKVFGYFNNHFHGYAPENCLYLVQRLGLLTDQQKRIKERASLKQADLNSFLGR